MTTIVRERVVAPAVPTTREVLRRAADLLEEFGWCQGKYGSKEHGAFCALGAAWYAEHEMGVDCGSEFPDIALALDDVVAWNDAPGRTKAEVVQRLREAAEAAA